MGRVSPGEGRGAEEERGEGLVDRKGAEWRGERRPGGGEEDCRTGEGPRAPGDDEVKESS